MKIVVVGGGASGVVAGICAKKKDNEVIILEREKEILRKLLKTGNGRCNYYNEKQEITCYHSNTSELLEKMITKDNLEKVQTFFKEIGILPRKRDGYYYPLSNQAISMRNALFLKAKELGITIQTNCLVTKIEKVGEQFLITTKKKTLYVDRVIVSTGSYASFQKIESVNSYQLLEEMGHTTSPLLPSLVQLKGKETYFTSWAGIRSDVKLSLYENNQLLKEEEGEIQLTDYGISGICTFNISREVSLGLYHKNKMKVVIDFLKDIERIEDFFDTRYQLLGNRTCKDFLEGVFHPRLIKIFLEKAKIQDTKRYSDLTKEERKKLESAIKSFSFEITSTNDFSKAQVVTGGILLSEINCRTMESFKVKGLYITGEVLDVDGICGGYNLTFAWISGILAGGSASIDSNKTNKN